MKNLKVSMKLVVSFLIVIALSVTVGIVGIIGMMQINDGSTEIYERQSVPLSDIAEAREYFQRLRVQQREVVIYHDDVAELGRIENEVNTRVQGFRNYMGRYRPTITSDTAIRDFDEAMRSFETYHQGVMQLLSNARGGMAQEELAQLSSEMRSTADSVMNSAAALMETRISQGAEVDQANDDTFARMLTIIIIVMVVAVVVAMVLALYISGIISKPLVVLSEFMKKAGTTGDINLRPEDVESISKFAQNKDEIGQTIGNTATFVKHITTVSDELGAVAGGDLSRDVKLLSNDDVMGKSIKQMLENLNNMFSEINSATSQVSTGSKQIAEGAQTLAQGSTEQAASIQQLSSSISEIAQRTKTNAETANVTSKLSETIKENAEKGSRQMDEMITAVGEINEASKNISKIIKTIDDIAFQTNILALNAAVEAARAGQHGKGFAVVAEEVRNLASKSAEAAKDTGDMIQMSMDKAELGSRIAGETAESLSEIVTGINESSHLISEIAQASEAQTQGIGQINTGIDQVAQVVQQNSATAEESAAASQEMSGQSSMLQQLITQFKLRNGGSGFYSLPSAAAPQRHFEPSVAEVFPQNDNGSDFGKY